MIDASFLERAGAWREANCPGRTPWEKLPKETQIEWYRMYCTAIADFLSEEERCVIIKALGAARAGVDTFAPDGAPLAHSMRERVRSSFQIADKLANIPTINWHA